VKSTLTPLFAVVMTSVLAAHRMEALVKRTLLAVALVALCAPAFAQSNSWTIEWLKSDRSSYNPISTNPVTLSIVNGNVTGSYVNDEKETCSVTGRISFFTVQCPMWRIELSQTTVSTDGRTISGTYFVPVGGKYKSAFSSYFRLTMN